MVGQRIAVIAEGEGEVAAVPVLIRRIAGEGFGRWDVTVSSPHRRPRNSLTAAGGIERFVTLATVKDPDTPGVLVIIDADDDCPAELGPTLQARAEAARPDLRVSVVLANREFEAWFLAAAPSLRGQRGLASDLAAHPAPEQLRDCKRWLTVHRTDGGVYKPTVDQAALAAIVDLYLARKNSSSFDKLWREVARLLGEKA